ncbi:MAG: macro domain-containing protein [Lachnospiraceae bacterium]|nr:macro domain-containing protein [Lachnospiraceae bacterium]
MAFQIIKADITKVKADAIVNSANPKPTYGRGVDSAIYHTAGAEALLKEREKIGVLTTGEAAVTPAFALPAKYIIHTVGPVWSGGNSGELLALEACYKNALKKAEELQCESIAFPMISTGVYGFPKDRALQTALMTIRNYLDGTDSEMEIMLVVYDRSAFQISPALRSNVEAYLNHQTNSFPTAAKFNYSAMPEAAPLPAKGKKRSRRNIGRPRRRKEVLQEPEADLSLTGELSIESLQERVAHVGDTFQQCLLRWIDEKGLTDVEVYKKANLDRKLFSKIRCNVNYVPKKQTAFALAIGLELTLDETKDLLRRAGLAFSPSSVFDLIIEYCIENALYDIFEINALLFDYDQPTLGC